MTTIGRTRIRVAALNCRPVGLIGESGRDEIDSVVTAIAALGPAPHILCLAETRGLRLYSTVAILALTRRLNELLPDDDVYYPFVSERPGTRNPPGLWLSARHIYPVADHPLPHPGDSRPCCETYPHTVEAMIADGHVWLKAVHWQDLESSHGSIVQSAIDSRLAAVPAVLLGKFATPSVEEASCEDWAARRQKTAALRRILHAGFWNVAEPAVGRSSGAGAADVHILVSSQTPARPVPGSYVLGPTTDSGTTPGVACELDFEARRAS